MRSLLGCVLLVAQARGFAPSRSMLQGQSRAVSAHHIAPIIARSRTKMLLEASASVTTTTLAFADQAGNLAGALFPASLPPYLLFLYFIRQDVNGLSPTAKAGFTSLLAFVFATVVTSIISVKSYGLPLANCDWLHSGAEQLLSFTNIADVIGLK